MRHVRLAPCLAPGLGLLLVLAAPPARAGVPSYGGFELQARSNFSGAFNLPDGAFFSSSTVALSDTGQVAIKVGVISGSDSQGIWVGMGGAGSLAYTSPSGAFLSDVDLDAAGRVIFEQVFASPDGLHFYDSGTMASGLLTNLPLGASDWGSPEINGSGQVGYRAGFSGGNAYASYDGTAAAIHATEVGIDAGSPYSFLFTPSFDDARRIAGKVRLGGAGQFGEERPDEIRIFEAGGASTLVAEDQDSDPGSPYDRFDNSVALVTGGRVAFIATLDGGVRGVFLSDGVTTVEIAREGVGEVSEVEFFGPAANASGLVAFRGVDTAGLQAIFVGDGTVLRRVVGEHDLLPTDLGTARVDQNDSSPVFGGGVALNDLGDLAFVATLTPPDDDQVEWGSGVFVAYGNGIFTDGFESGDLLAWSSSVP